MTLGERVFNYCERGTNEALWAEPINAISNAGFFLAALIFWQLVLWRPPEQRSADHYLFIALVLAICFGSTAFHVYADHGTALADVIPIGLFMLVYFGFALNRFLNAPPGWTVLFVVVFAGTIAASTQIQCWDGGVGFAATAPDEAKSCLNGSVGYLPALAALIIVSMLVAERRHKAAPYLLAATLVFIGSVLLRSLDFAFCDIIVIDGRHTGTHFIWHLLNAVVLFLLMRASLETETKPLPAPAAAKEPAEDEEPAEDKSGKDTSEEDMAEEGPTKEDKPEEDAPEQQGDKPDDTESKAETEPDTEEQSSAKAEEAPDDRAEGGAGDDKASDDASNYETSDDKTPEDETADSDSSEDERRGGHSGAEEAAEEDTGDKKKGSS